MPTYIGFLRAVNVGQRKYPMAELRNALEAAGFSDVETHIQTGNVRVTTPKRSVASVSAALEKVFEADRGWPVPTIVVTPAELTAIAETADEVADPPAKHAQYVEVLRDAPSAAARRTIEGQELAGQRAVVKDRAVHLLFDVPYHEAKAPNAAVKKAMGDSTNRNLKVIRALADKWGD